MQVIKEEIIKAFKREMKNHPQKQEKTIYVTDLLHCVLRPQKEIPDTWLIRGTAIHTGIRKLLSEYGELKIEFEKNVAKQFGEYVLMGRIDGMLEDGTVVEFKTSANPPTFPYDQHLYQILIYMNITGAKRGILLYLGNNEIREFVINEESIIETDTGQTFLGQYSVDDEWIRKQIMKYVTKTLIATFDECKFCEINDECKFSKVRKNAKKN